MAAYKFPITIEKMNDDETWTPVLSCRARVNSFGGKEYAAAGTYQADETMQFEVRYCKVISKLIPQETRIIYDGHEYDVVFIDDFMQEHKVLKFRGVVNFGRQ
jgi:SPP1 family predicted phage head-tail adaptor